MNLLHSKRIFGLDFLRALAISLVVVSHASLLVFPNSEHIILTFIKTLGAVGVDLFFVLSGFLIGGIILKLIERNKTSFKDLVNFWMRRWFRTLPNYYLILILNIGLFLFLDKDLPQNIGSYFLFIQNFSIPHPDFFTEAWSLSVEEYAYLCLPLILYMGFKFFKNRDKSKIFIYTTVITILFLLLIKIKYFYSVDVSSHSAWSSSYRKVVIYRMDAIYVGFLAVYFMRNYSVFFMKYKRVLGILGIFIFFGIHLIIYAFNLTPNTNLFFYVFMYLQIVILSLAFLFPYFYYLNYKGIFLKPIQFLSVHSYSIYLLNYSIILLNFQNIFIIENMSIIQKSGIMLLFLTITIILSMLLYKYFELPILKYRNRKFK